jgi:curli biogenesis system outer membrane secretion channel CsgG
LIFRRLLPAACCLAFVILAPVSALPAQQASVAVSASQLEQLAGHYTDPSEPGGGFDFYVNDGQLTIESTRLVPTALNPVTSTIFGVAGSSYSLTFTLSTSGQGASVTLSDQPGTVYERTGEPGRCITSFTITCALKP